MIIEYLWAMPNNLTFKIKPIANFIEKKGITIDPFSNRKHVFADITNDINPDSDTHFNMCALEFLKGFDDQSIDTLLYDPPYSLRQLKEVYSGIGMSLNYHHTTRFFSDVKDEISRILRPGGSVFSFGWDSVGMGKNRGFNKTNLLLVCHGGAHHDTICLKEVKK